jgi:aminopeptidase-like protein
VNGARVAPRGIMELQKNFSEQLVTDGVGEQIFALAAKLYPICRSITGDGVRETLREIGTHIGLEMHEVPTGTPVFDWIIPREWNIRDAYIKNERGEKIVNFAQSNLHVVSYSAPVRRLVSLAELKKHVHSLPEQPDLIPYRTSYYTENWGFCMTHRLLESLRDETYEVLIDSSLQDGFLIYGEYLHKGETEDEFLLSAHVCHPSLANDNCSGVALLTHLAKRMAGLRTRYSYRFLFAPGTIGAITWLSRNEDRARLIKHGLVISMVGVAMLRSIGLSSTYFITPDLFPQSSTFFPMAMMSASIVHPGSTYPSGYFSAACLAQFLNITPRQIILHSSAQITWRSLIAS